MRSKKSYTLVFVSILILLFSFPVQAAITFTGSVEPDPSSGDIIGVMFWIGINEYGYVSIDDASVLKSSSSFVGFGEGYSGEVTIDGFDSQWEIYPLSEENPGLLTVGWSGVGNLNITNSGKLLTFCQDFTNWDCFSLIAYDETTGTVNLSNSAEWFDEGKIGLGHSGYGEMNVETNSQVSSKYIYIGDFPGATGILNISGGSSVKINDTIWLSQRDNTTSIVTVSGTSSLLQAGGQIVVSQWPGYGEDETGSIAALDVKDGAIVRAPDVYMDTGGTISGNSLIEGTLHNAGGIVSPGASVGTLTINGNFRSDEYDDSDSALIIEINESGNDLLDVSGNAYLAGILNVELLDSYQPDTGSVFIILTAGETLHGTFVNTDMPVFDGRTFEVQYDEVNGQVELHVVDIALPMTIDINPDTLNLKSKGNYVTCYIELPEGYNVGDIKHETIKLTILGFELFAESTQPQIGDNNNNNIPDLMVKFDRQSVQDACITTGAVEMLLSCETNGGDLFNGIDTVLVIDKGKEHTSEDHGSVAK